MSILARRRIAARLGSMPWQLAIPRRSDRRNRRLTGTAAENEEPVTMRPE
jgi:hypothetical protein